MEIIKDFKTKTLEDIEIVINEKYLTHGLISVNVAKSEEAESGVIITGRLRTHCYIEEITSLQSMRLKINGIEVFSESYGNADNFIIYDFTCKNFEVNGGMSLYNTEELEKLNQLLLEEVK